MNGRWEIFVCTGCGEATGRHKDCDATREKTPAVPCDDGTIERIWPLIAAQHEFSGDYAYEVVCDVFKAAAETP